MTDISGLYDPADEPGSGGGGDYVPAGTYEVAIVYSEMKQTADGYGRFLYLELNILQGEHAGKTLVDRLNLENNNQQAVDIARRSLASIRHATGVMAPQTAEELFNIPMLAQTKDEMYEGNPQTRIKRYKPIEQQAAKVGPVSQPQTQQQAPDGYMPRGAAPSNALPPRPGPNRPPVQGGPQRPPRPPSQPPYGR